MAELFLKLEGTVKTDGPGEAGAAAIRDVSALSVSVSLASEMKSSYGRDYLCFVPPLKISLWPRNLGKWTRRDSNPYLRL